MSELSDNAARPPDGEPGFAPKNLSGLRIKAREAMQLGRLPTRAPSATWGGKGSGAGCAVCEIPISPTEVELEIEFALENGAVSRYRLHPPCCSAWTAELNENMKPPPPILGESTAGSKGNVRQF